MRKNYTNDDINNLKNRIKILKNENKKVNSRIQEKNKRIEELENENSKMNKQLQEKTKKKIEELLGKKKVISRTEEAKVMDDKEKQNPTSGIFYDGVIHINKLEDFHSITFDQIKKTKMCYYSKCEDR